MQKIENKRFQRKGSWIMTKTAKKSQPKKIWVENKTEIVGELEKFAKLKEYNFTQQWVRPSLHLLDVHYNPWKT